MLTLLLSLALSAQAATPPDTRTVATAKRVMARVVACGVPGRDARFRVDATLQEAVVDIGSASALTDSQLACLAQVSVDTVWFLVFDDATEARYDPLYYSASVKAGHARAEAWVAARGLTARVPRLDAARQDRAAKVGRIEALCGAPPGSFHDLFLPDPVAAPNMPDVPDEIWLCVSNVAIVSGLEMGFTGKEAVPPVPPR